MENHFRNTPFTLFSSSKKKPVIVIGKTQANFIGILINFDTQSNFSLNYVLKVGLNKKKTNIKLYKEIILNGSKICFLSIL